MMRNPVGPAVKLKVSMSTYGVLLLWPKNTNARPALLRSVGLASGSPRMMSAKPSPFTSPAPLRDFILAAMEAPRMRNPREPEVKFLASKFGNEVAAEEMLLKNT
jgi:hypothetical protein